MTSPSTMAGFSTSSAWILLFLQLNAILASQSVPKAKCRSWTEFHKSVATLEGPVKDCSENCYTDQMSVDRKCQCLHLSMSPEDDPLPGFFIQGVEALNSTLQASLKPGLIRIIKKLNHTGYHCEIDSISSLQREKPSIRSVIIISPKVFVKKLKGLGEELKANLLGKSL